MMFCVALVCATVFNGCSKKDDDSNDPQKQIIGKWKVTTVNLTLNGSPVTGAVLEDAKENIGLTMDFKSDLSFTSKGAEGITRTGTYLFSDGVLKLTGNETGEVDSDPVKITISESKLIINTKYYVQEITYDQELIFARVN